MSIILSKANSMKTPMKRLTTHFSLLTKASATSFSNFCLNESKGKSIPWSFAPYDNMTGEYKYHTKAVESDHIKVYKDKKSDVSFAFIFDYKEKSEDEWRIHVSIKVTNSKYFCSELYTFDEFRLKLNEFNKKMLWLISLGIF